MVRVRKRKIGNSEYYYLEHAMKINGRVVKKELYLGSKIPKNVEDLKAGLLNEIMKERWFKKLDLIRSNFSKEYKTLPRLAKKKHTENFMVNFTYSTNRIEGGTLTLRETANLLEEGITPKDKPIKDVKETESHKKVFYLMLEHRGDLNLETVLHWHRLLFQSSEPEIAGRIRNHQVAIYGSKTELPFPAELNFLLRDFFKWYNKNKTKLHPVELAALVHLKFVSIHPFTDGNGRISRLMMNFVLHKHGFPMLDISYENRSGYYNALEKSQLKKLGYVFAKYLIRLYSKEYGRYLKSR